MDVTFGELFLEKKKNHTNRHLLSFVNEEQYYLSGFLFACRCWSVLLHI